MLVIKCRQLLAGILMLLVSSACQQLPIQPSERDLAQRFEAAMHDASRVEEGENYASLFPITQNKRIPRDAEGRIKVVTWKNMHGYNNHIKRNSKTFFDPEFVLWVTAVPQVREFCSAYVQERKPDSAALNLRLKQYLGLRYDWDYDVFVELWVDPKDLFRPCVDPETDDTQCNLAFTAKRSVVPSIPDYKAFYEHLYFKSFRLKDRMPWTGLGYTYDWGSSGKPVGASEYIMRPDAPYQIDRVMSTQEYCQAP